MGTVTDIKKGIDEDKTGVVSVRVIASLMAIVEAKHHDVPAEKAAVYCALAYKNHLNAAADAVANAEVLDGELRRLHAEVAAFDEDIQ